LALLLVPVVLLQRKEPSSTVAWILVLIFLPGAGAVLFLMFGRERVRIPLRRKPSADRALAEKNAPISSSSSSGLRVAQARSTPQTSMSNAWGSGSPSASSAPNPRRG